MKKALYGLFSIPSFRNKYLALTILAALFILPFCGFSQTYTQIHNAQAIDWIAAVKTLHVPSGPTPVLNSTRTLPGAIFFNTTDSAFYGWTGTRWFKISGGAVDPNADSTTLHGFILCNYIGGASTCVNLKGDTTIFDPVDFTLVRKELSGSRYDTVKLKNKAGGSSVFFDSSSINYNNTLYVYYNAGVPVDSVSKNSSVNLSNTNLTQNGNRQYDAGGYPLNFFNFSNIGFANATSSLYLTPSNTIVNNNTKITIAAPVVSFPSTVQNDALTRIAVLDGSNNLAWRNVSTITGGGAAAWGSITGTLSAQSDLQAALNLKASQTALQDSAAAIRADFPTGGTTTGLYQEVIATAGQTTVPFTTVPAATAKFSIVRNTAIIPKTFYSISGNNIIFTSGLQAGDSIIIQGVQ